MKPPTQSPVLAYILMGVACSCLLFCGAGAFMTFKSLEQSARSMAPLAACKLEATALRDALVAYANRNGGLLPSASEWKAAVAEGFIARRDELRRLDPALRTIPAGVSIQWSEADGIWGCRYDALPLQAFSYNLELAEKKLADIKDPERQVLVFETPAKENQALAYRPRADRSQPRIMGELRDWIVMPVVGEMINVTGVGQGSPASR